MNLDHRTLAKIQSTLKKTDMNAMLLDNNGNVLLPEKNERVFQLPEGLRSNPTKPFVYGDFTLIGTDNIAPLFLCLSGNSIDVQNCAILCAEIVNMLTAVDLPHADREQAYRSILCDRITGTELESLAQSYCIPMEKMRCVLVFHLTKVNMETILGIMRNVIAENSGDVLIEVDMYTVALIKSLNDAEEYEEMEQLAFAIQSTVVNETSHYIDIGIGEMKKSLSQLSESYFEARKAIDVGRVYHAENNVFPYGKLLLERFLSESTPDVCQKYHQMIFNRKTARILNEEMLNTIDKFFENSLNLSETARQIYIHRNTLVYRLDKIERTMGLDLRKFDDAVTFKLMMMLGMNTEEHGYKK